MLALAYDGSVNGDWVAHYATRFATRTAHRRLRVLHVHAGEPEAHVLAGLARIDEACKREGVALERELLSRGGGTVADRISGALPGEATLIAGTRARARRMALLAGTVTAELMASSSLRVVALRVVHPGVLGQPGRALLPVGERGAEDALPLLRLLGPDLRRLHLLHVKEVSRLRFRLLSQRGAARLAAEAERVVADAERTLAAALGAAAPALEASAVVSDDAAKEILIHAGRHRSRLVCLGATRDTLPGRLIVANPIEQVLREAPCDVAVYAGAAR